MEIQTTALLTVAISAVIGFIVGGTSVAFLIFLFLKNKFSCVFYNDDKPFIAKYKQ